MFERFTDRSRRVIVLAQEEARSLGHNYIGTEHVLLGLISEGEGVGAQALANLGFSTEYLRGRVVEVVGRGDSKPTGHIPFTPRSKKVLEFGHRESLQLGLNYIGTEHILLGLVREGEGKAAEILIEKAPLQDVRREVISILTQYLPPTPAEPEPHTVTDSIIVCTAELDLLASPRHRAAVLAFLSAWYSS